MLLYIYWSMLILSVSTSYMFFLGVFYKAEYSNVIYTNCTSP